MSHNPTHATPAGLTRARFRLYPFRSPLLRASLLFSLPPGTEMFQFPGFPEPALYIQTGLTGHDPSRVSPFGHPWICGWLAPPQGLSQLPTSFIGSRCQGIHRVLFHTCRTRCSRSLSNSQRTTHPTTPTSHTPKDVRYRRTAGQSENDKVSLSELHRARQTTHTQTVPRHTHHTKWQAPAKRPACRC